jgi:hypothetical protein
VVDRELLQLVDFLEKRKTISANRYVQTLNKFRHALREKRLKKKTVIFQHNALHV